MGVTSRLQLTECQSASAITRFGRVLGGLASNRVRVFLQVPYGESVPRWTDPQPLSSSFSYSDGPYVKRDKFAAQPECHVSGGMLMRAIFSGGSALVPASDYESYATENPFLLDIFVPPQTSRQSHGRKRLYAVKVFFHGGALQHGSTWQDGYDHQHYRAEAFNEIRVMVSYRLGVFGFLAAQTPYVAGNFGFKDCWLALQWIKGNIEAFGGDPEDVHISGLSAGAHITHQLLYHVTRSPKEKAPFVSATLHSNAMVSDPASLAQKDDQFKALCVALGIPSDDPKTLSKLRDTSLYPTKRIMDAVEKLGAHSTFRGVGGEDGWVAKDLMAFQRSGGLGKGLRDAGVRCVVLGDVKDEICFYGSQHPVTSVSEILPNLVRYYLPIQCQALLDKYPKLSREPSIDELNTLQGQILSDAQSHFATRLLAKDLEGYVPVVRYHVQMALKSSEHYPQVSHGSDNAIHHWRINAMTTEEKDASLRFDRALDQELDDAPRAGTSKSQEGILILTANGETVRGKDPLILNKESASSLESARLALRPEMTL